MFGMGVPEILLILALALIIIGPKKIPDLAKSLGKALGEFKRATSDFKDAIDIEDVKNPLNDIKDDIKSSVLDDIEDDDNSSEGLEREDFSEIKDEKSDKASELKTDQKKESE